MSIDECLDLEREDRDHESTQARYARRLKFACCPECGGNFGMRGVARDELAAMSILTIRLLAPLYREPGNSEYLFFTCRDCNKDKIIPDGFELIAGQSVLAWANEQRPMAPDYAAPTTDLSQYDWGEDPREMEPDYAALAAEPEPVLASQVDRESAGLEG